MAHPKRRTSNQRRDKRRTHYKLTTQPFIVDDVSGTPSLYHRVNLASGYYKGRQVMKGEDE